MDEMLKELWNAANIHSAMLDGEYLVPGSEGMPQRPANDEDTIRIVADYLRDTI